VLKSPILVSDGSTEYLCQRHSESNRCLLPCAGSTVEASDASSAGSEAGTGTERGSEAGGQLHLDLGAALSGCLSMTASSVPFIDDSGCGPWDPVRCDHNIVATLIFTGGLFPWAKTDASTTGLDPATFDKMLRYVYISEENRNI
jgi:hypothetical protein